MTKVTLYVILQGYKKLSIKDTAMLMGRYFTTDKIDTRSYDLETGKAIPGTGDVHTCEHCGADHEVWVYVESEDRKHSAVVGSSCAKRLRLVSREKFEKTLVKQASNLNKRIAQLLHGPNYTSRLDWLAVRVRARVMRRMGYTVTLLPSQKTFRVA